MGQGAKQKEIKSTTLFIDIGRQFVWGDILMGRYKVLRAVVRLDENPLTRSATKLLTVRHNIFIKFREIKLCHHHRAHNQFMRTSL